MTKNRKIYKMAKVENMVKTVLSAFLLAALPCQAGAQIVVDDNDTDDEIDVIDEMGNREEIDFPEAMSYNMDSLMNLYVSKTYISPDNDCRMTNENPTFSKDEYMDRLRRMPTIMDMSYNDVVQTCIDRYTGRLRRQVSWMLGASNFYMPIFEEALEAYQLPLELKYLPIVESALNPTAVSRAGATGLWQFMLGTGKMYGLEVNSLVDERRDPVKASYAAAHYLSDLYRIFGDWTLVIAAYNCGPENINKAIRRAGGVKDYWKIYPYLPRETRGYVPAFIAANYAMNYYCEHNICPMNTDLPVKTDTVMIDRNVEFAQIAAVCGFDIQMLRSLNPAYRRDIVPGNTALSPLRLPLADVGTFIDLQDSVYAMAGAQQKPVEVVVEDNAKVQAPAAGKKYHKVRRGETLGGIARKYHTTASRIRSLNGLRSNTIRTGQRLRVR